MTDFNDEELDRLEAQLPFRDEHGNLIMWSPTVQMFNKLAASISAACAGKRSRNGGAIENGRVSSRVFGG